MPYSYATHLECSLTGERYDIGKLQGVSAAGKPLLVRYDLAALRREVSPEDIEARAPGLWRWHELLPVPNPAGRLRLGEIETPLIPLARSERPAGFRPPVVKDEGRLPTGSFSVDMSNQPYCSLPAATSRAQSLMSPFTRHTCAPWSAISLRLISGVSSGQKQKASIPARAA